MNTKNTPELILQEIAQIQRLDRGTVSILREGPEGPYYNHQCYEKGRNVSRYVPAEEVAALKEAIAEYKRFQELINQYIELMVGKTRAERQAGVKKKTRLRSSSSLRIRKSSS
jgi:hypothetical protein